MSDRALESEIRSPATEYAIRRGWFHERIRTTRRRGFVDDIYARRGRILFVEYKRPDGEPRKSQLVRHKQMREHGMEVHVIDSLEAAQELFY